MDTKKMLICMITPIVAFASLSVISIIAAAMQSGFAGDTSPTSLVLGAIWSIMKPLSFLLAGWATVKYGFAASKKFDLGTGEIALGSAVLGILFDILFVQVPFSMTRQAGLLGTDAVWGAGFVVLAIILSIFGMIWGRGERATGTSDLET